MLRNIVLSITLMFSACSQETPLSTPGRGISASQEKVSDLALQLLVTEESREIRYENYEIHPLSQSYGVYHNILLQVFDSEVLNVGLLNENTGAVEWFNKATKQVEQCVLSSTVTFNPIELEDQYALDIMVGMAASDTEVALMCHGNINQNQPLILIDNSIFVFQPPALETVDTDIEEFDSLKVTVVDTTLMVHLDDLDDPSFAIVYQYLDERALDPLASEPKRLRKVFPLSIFDPENADVLSDLALPMTQGVSEDPLQHDVACSLVPAFYGDETIFISFKRSYIKQTTMLDGLCGIYFTRTKRFFSAEPSVGAFVGN